MNYFTSDWHFGHNGMLKFERFRFNSIEEHDDYIINSIENKVTQNDTLYFLGDIGYPTEEIKQRIKNLPCYKIMIRGNHDDHGSDFYKRACGFDEVYNHPIFLSKRIVLSHEPIPVTDGTINVHGHLHGTFINKPNYINVSIHVANYTLLSQKYLDKYLIKLKKDNEKFLQEWYADLYVQTEEAFNFRNDLLVDSNKKIIGFKRIGLITDERIEINKKNLMNRNIIIGNSYGRIIEISDDGSIVTVLTEDGVEDFDIDFIKIA